MLLVNHLNFNKLEARNMVISVLGTAPVAPVIGQEYYDSTALIAYIWNGTAWTSKATDSLLLGGQNLAYTVNRINHTGTQTSSTISDLATTVQAYRLDQFTGPNVSLSLNSQRIINLADPVGPQDAATMGWVQTQVNNAAAGIDAKPSVRLATTVNDTLSGLAARDGVTPIAGDRVLSKNQTTTSANGVYVAAAGAWTRAVDADGAGELTPGAFWYVEEGTTQGKTQWRIENTGTIVLGTTGITINQFGGAATSYTASLGITLVANDFRAQVVASGGIQAVAGGLQIDTAIVSRKFTAVIAGTTTATVTHSLNTQDVVVSVRDSTTNEVVLADVICNGVNTVTVATATGGAGAYRVTVIG